MTRSKLLAAALAIVLSGPATAALADGVPSRASSSSVAPPGDKYGVGEMIYLAAQTVAERAGILVKDQPILVATFVSIDDMSASTTFGRLASQLVANRLVQDGYSVKDINYTGAVTVREGTGELVLTRDVARISRSLHAQAVVAGTYAVAGRQIFLNVRLLNAETGDILSAADVVIRRDPNTDGLMASMGEALPALR